MKALSLWNPWAWLVALGYKKVETREWTRYRGPLAIHATASIPPRWLGSSRFVAEFESELADVLGCDRRVVHRKVKELPRGVILCVVRLAEIEPVENVREGLSRRERIFGNYDDGRWAWHLELVETFLKPMPAKGNRMLWNWRGA